jgi:hypothetical protein
MHLSRVNGRSGESWIDTPTTLVFRPQTDTIWATVLYLRDNEAHVNLSSIAHQEPT